MCWRHTYRYLVLIERIDVRGGLAARVGRIVEEFLRIQNLFFFTLGTTTEQHPDTLPFYPFNAEDTFYGIDHADTWDADARSGTGQRSRAM